jgi:hypothetical protein
MKVSKDLVYLIKFLKAETFSSFNKTASIEGNKMVPVFLFSFSAFVSLLW